MAETDPPRARPPRDWTNEVADRIENVVTTVRDRTTVPIQKIARYVVYGLVAAVVGPALLLLLIIGVMRLHVYLPFHPEGRRVWTMYVAIGAIFVVAGLFMWRKRNAQPQE